MKYRTNTGNSLMSSIGMPESRPQRGNFFTLAKAAVAVGAAAMSLVALDGWLGKRQWPSSDTRLHGTSDVEAMITFSGLGSMGGEQQAGDIARIFSMPGLHWEYSTDSFSIDGLVKALSPRLKGVNRIGLNGHSMGGPAGLEVLSRAAPDDAVLGPVVLHGSPFDYTDARSHKYARLLNAIRIPTGPASKVAFSLLRSGLEGTPPWAAWGDAINNATTGCSPRLWLEQIRTLHQLHLENSRDRIANMTNEDTRVWYCRPADPEMDRTIDTVRASARYAEFFGSMGVPFEVVEVPGAGHADVTQGCAALALRLG